MIRRLSIILCALVFIFLSGRSAFAITAPNQQSLNNDTLYYDPNATGASCAPGGSNATLYTVPTFVPNAATSGTWSSNIPAGPYYYEEFAIQVLKDVAKKSNTSESTVVTQDHVIGLMAWFFKEGGDIMDGPPRNNATPNLFNLLNTSITDPSIETTYGGGGIESFKSFNDGVEGTARTMVGSFQDRVAAVLTTPGTTANQVAETIADFQYYPGNHSWAVSGSTQADIIANDQTNYLPDLLQIITQIRADYSSYGTWQIGTPSAEFTLNEHVSPSLLVYAAGASSVNGTPVSGSPQASSTSCGGAVSCNSASPVAASSTQLSQVRQDVVCIANNELAAHWTPITPTTNYPYFKTYTPTAENWCADFVSWVYNQAGYPLGSGGAWRVPGVATIYSIGNLNQNFHYHGESSNYVPVPGDMAIHYDSSQTNPYFHVDLVIAVNTTTKATTYLGGDETNPLYGNATVYGSNGTSAPSTSIVASGTVLGYYNYGIIGYVSPD